jgi:hypothetical protein
VSAKVVKDLGRVIDDQDVAFAGKETGLAVRYHFGLVPAMDGGTSRSGPPCHARVGASDHVAPFSLRVTNIRREDRGWKLAHRHADPITTPRPIESVLA